MSIKKSPWLWIAVALIATALIAFILIPAVTNTGHHHGYRQLICASQARQLVQAIAQYDLEHGVLPPAYEVRNGHMHSWRILLLPQLELKALYDEYRFDEPWNGPNNSKLADQMPMIYRCPTDPFLNSNDHATNYFVITGRGTVLDRDESVSLQSILDHDSKANTLILVEAVNTGVHWMEPRDLSIDDIDKAFDVNAGKFMSSYHSGGANVVYADSRAVFMLDTIDRTVLRALFTYKGGEVLSDPDLP